MAQRLRLYDLRTSRLPTTVGACVGDVNRIAQLANSAQRRLIYDKGASDEGWWGTYAEVLFSVPWSSPFITLPREIARIISATVCNKAVPVQNQYYQYLQFGNGRLPKFGAQLCPGRPTQLIGRNNAVTFVDLTPAPQFIAVYPTSNADVEAARRVLIQGLDQNNATIYSNDGTNKVIGEYLTLETPFVQTPMPLNNLTGIQKDVTDGPVQIYQVDPTTGAQVLLLTMEPGEEVANYRRYYIDGMPKNCCATPGTPAITQVSTICKLDPIDVVYDTDYLLFQNLEALIEECQAVRYSEMDSANAVQLEAKCHSRAIGHLKGELTHYLGKNDPALSFKPFGSASLDRLRITMQ